MLHLQHDQQLIRSKAREAYASDELQIDTDAAISDADEGFWVAAWVWVPNPDNTEQPEAESLSTEELREGFRGLS